MKKTLLLGAIVGVVVFVIVGGFVKTFGEERGQELLIEKDNAESLDVQLEFGVGEFLVSGGSNEWVTGAAEYNSRKLKPSIEYKQKGKTGKVKIEQSDNVSFGFQFGELKNKWDVELTNDVPLNLTIHSGVAETELDLVGLNLNKLKVDSGVGDTTINLSGDWQKSFKAEMNMGVGNVTIILPENVGVKITSSEGIGAANVDGLISQGNNVYVNEAYEHADVTIEISMDLGVGNVDFITE